MLILVVDEKRDALETISHVLKQKGHQVHTAVGAIAVSNLLHINDYDVILIDQDLFLLTGRELASRMRTSLEGKRLPRFVAICSGPSVLHHDPSSSDVFDAYLLKPFNFARLEAALVA